MSWQCGCGAVHSDNEIECPFQFEDLDIKWVYEENEDEDYDDIFEYPQITDEKDEELTRRELSRPYLQ